MSDDDLGLPSAAAAAAAAPAPARAKRVRKVFTEDNAAGPALGEKPEAPTSGAKILTYVRGLVIGAPSKVRGGSIATFMVLGRPGLPLVDGDTKDKGSVEIVSGGEIIFKGNAACVALKNPDQKDRDDLKARRERGEAVGYTAYKRNETDYRHIIMDGCTYKAMVTCSVNDGKPFKQNSVYKFGVKEWQLITAGPSGFGDSIDPQIAEVEYIDDYSRFRGAKCNAALFSMHMAAQYNPKFTQLVLNSTSTPNRELLPKLKANAFTPETRYIKNSQFIVPLFKGTKVISERLAGQSEPVVRYYSNAAFDDSCLPYIKVDTSGQTPKYDYLNRLTFNIAVSQLLLKKEENIPANAKTVLDMYNARDYTLKCTAWLNALRSIGLMDVRQMRAGMAGAALLEHMCGIMISYAKPGSALPSSAKQGKSTQTLEMSTTGAPTEIFTSRSSSSTMDIPVSVCDAGYEISKPAALRILAELEVKRRRKEGIPDVPEGDEPEPAFYDSDMSRIKPTDRRDEKDEVLPNNFLNDKGSMIINLNECTDNLNVKLDAKWTIIAIANAGAKRSDIGPDGTECNHSAGLHYYLELRATSEKLHADPTLATPAQMAVMRAEMGEGDEEAPLFPKPNSYANAEMGRILTELMVSNVSTAVDAAVKRAFPLPKDTVRAGEVMQCDVLMFAINTEYLRARGLNTTTAQNAYPIIAARLSQVFPEDLEYLEDVGEEGLGKQRAAFVDPADAPVVVSEDVPDAPPPRPTPAPVDDSLSAAEEAALAAADAMLSSSSSAAAAAAAPAAKTAEGSTKRTADAGASAPKRRALKPQAAPLDDEATVLVPETLPTSSMDLDDDSNTQPILV